MSSRDLIDAAQRGETVALRAGITLLRGFADDAALWSAVQAVLAAAPPRRMATPGGRRMSAAMTNCGSLGWVSDTRGYRYTQHDPHTGLPWPVMPRRLHSLASAAAAQAGFAGFSPDACLINEYIVGARMGLHRDSDEQDFSQPIVSVSLGVPAVFLIGGERRKDTTEAVRLGHGDVVVFGGPARLVYHGVRPIREQCHPLLGQRRINLTFRRAR